MTYNVALYAHEQQGGQYHQQRDDFAADVLLFEEENAVKEGYHQAYTIEDQWDEYDDCRFLGQPGEVDDIGYGAAVGVPRCVEIRLMLHCRDVARYVSTNLDA